MRTTLILVTYGMIPEALLESVPSDPGVQWYVAHHGPEPRLSEQIGAVVERRGGTFVPHNVNRGLARSWNDGIKAALNDHSDMIMLLNDDLHFCPGGFEQFSAFSAQEFAKHSVGMTFVTGYESDGVYKGTTQNQGFACCAISPALVDTIGYFDENFFPAYYEDLDYMRRIGMMGLTISIDPRCLVEHARSSTMRNDPELSAAHERNVQGCRDYYIQKWGGDLDQATFIKPFNDCGAKIAFADRAAPYGPGRDRGS